MLSSGVSVGNRLKFTVKTGERRSGRIFRICWLSQITSSRINLRKPCQFVDYVGEESPVEGAWFEEEKSSCS